MTVKLADQSIAELHSTIEVLIKRRLKLRMDMASGTNKSKDTSQFKKIRRQIAQIMTHLRERSDG